MSIKIYFGVPGSGKTTLAAKIVLENLKRGVKTFTNVPIKGGLLFNPADLGVLDISDGQMILDEAGIVFNSRKFKTLPQSTIEWLKLSRHYGITDIHVFSQSYDDMDITLRRLADEIYVIKRSLIPYVFSKRRIKVKVGIDKDTHQIMDQYFFQFLGINSYVGYHFWHMFDSWSAPVLPVSSWYYSSYQDFTIDKKHSKIIYRDLHKQGKLRYKLWMLMKRLFTRKNKPEKELEKSIKRFLDLSRNTENSEERAPWSGEREPPIRAAQAHLAANVKDAKQIKPEKAPASPAEEEKSSTLSHSSNVDGFEE